LISITLPSPAMALSFTTCTNQCGVENCCQEGFVFECCLPGETCTPCGCAPPGFKCCEGRSWGLCPIDHGCCAEHGLCCAPTTYCCDIPYGCCATP
jgi:hypothetical protein